MLESGTVKYQQIAARYDEIAAGYDARWSVHMSEPQKRLTEALGLSPGLRCADLGCGTGIDTLEMARQIAPTAPFAVDCSEEMLEAARRRARAEGYALETVCTDAESFLRQTPAESLDVLSLRFCLAYVPWREIVSGFRRVLRPRGRVGILTNLATSTPQALLAYHRMIEEIGVPEVGMPVPESLDALTDALSVGGLDSVDTWSHHFRLWFGSGHEVADWLVGSGFITHPMLNAAPASARRAFQSAFAERVEEFREPEGVPLDFHLAGVVARRD